MTPPFSPTICLLRNGIDQGLHRGAQVCVVHHGDVVADLALGESSPGVPMTTNTINRWMSSCKPVAAVAIAQLRDRSLLSFDDPVVKFIPEFGANGKETITIRHLLTHTAGIRWAGALTYREPWDVIISRICSMHIESGWIVGQTGGYHHASTWFILAEIIRRLDGRTYDCYVREEIFLPLGMNDGWIGMDRAAHRAYGDRIGGLYNTSKQPVDWSNDSRSEDACAEVNPAGNGRGPMNQLAKLYAALRAKDEGGRMKDERGSNSSFRLHPSSSDELVLPHRVGVFDQTFKAVINFGLGFILNSNKWNEQPPPYGYGPHAGERTFGHSGAESSCAFCDPDNDLIVAWVCNGMAGDAAHQQRQLAINTAIYEDLGLTTT